VAGGLPGIVPLSVTINPNDSSFAIGGVFWLTVPANNVLPNPGATSQVKSIDQVTLAALRAGTLQEQPFTSGYFPSGSSAAVVQTSSTTPPALATLYSTAQAVLTAAAAPVSGIIGSGFFGGAWSALSTAPVFDPVAQLKTDIYWAASGGLVPGMSNGRATGYAATSAASNKAVNATAYTPQGSNAIRSLVSTSASDSSAGTGAQQVTITGLSAAFVVASEVVTMNGTTPVATVNQYAYLESMVVTQVGSAGSNQGVISLGTTSSGGTAWASIAVNGGVGDNQTFYAHHYVPAGFTCYLLDFNAASSAAAATVFLARTGLPSATNLPIIQIGPTLCAPATNQTIEHPFQSALAIAGPDLIQGYAHPLAATASTSFFNFEYLQF
jgi:hypothetical protein